MAVVLDINLLCNNMLNFSQVVSYLAEYNVSLESMSCIDNWMWENEIEIEVKQFANILEINHIIIIKLKHPLIKDIGIYIEKIENQFLYTLWINTESYTMLDCEKLTKENIEFYQKIVQSVLDINKQIGDLFEVVGIGLETEFYYDKNVKEIIQKSKNMMIWMLKKYERLNLSLELFKIDVTEDMYILKKI